MKTFARFFIGIFIMVCGFVSVNAQDVYITVPETNIFNRTELITAKKILYTGSNNKWRISGSHKDPKIWSTSGNLFLHESLPSFQLSSSVLHWQLLSIGGAPVLHGTTPSYKYFNFNQQTWFQPGTHAGQDYAPGDVIFNFKIPTSEYSNKAFYTGNYSIDITHNYKPIQSEPYVIHFTPSSLKVKLAIPAAVSWLTNTPTKYIEISSLNDYSSTSAHQLGDLGIAELGNTVDFNLWAKASSANIQFTSSKGVTGTRSISTIKLGSAEPKLITAALSSTSQNYSSSSFVVKTGNRNNFILQLSTSAADFRAHFFEAGNYTFQLNLEAKSTDGTVFSSQNTEVTLKVLPLSEISIPTSGQMVNFNFNTSADYSQGQSKIIPNQIKLSNNETFELYVRSDENYFKKGGVQTDLNSNILQIGVNGGSLNIPLSTTTQKIIAGGTPVLDQELDMKYSIHPTGAQSLVGKEKSTYSINVIFSYTAL